MRKIIRQTILTLLLFAISASVFSQESDVQSLKCQYALWDPVNVPPKEILGDKTLRSIVLSKDRVRYTLSLSGGGYRAMLFHIGTLRRINDAKLLSKLSIVASVSGGSITAAILAHRWADLLFDKDGYATNFIEVIENPIRKLASQSIAVPSVVAGILSIKTASEFFSEKLNDVLFSSESKQKAQLDDIRPGPLKGSSRDRPVFIFLATNLQTGELWQFRANVVGGGQVGWTESRDIALSDAVAASAGFPPFFAPLKLKLDGSPQSWFDCIENRDNPYGIDPQNEPARAIDSANRDSLRAEVYLADGGIRDNLGIGIIEQINRINRMRFQTFALDNYYPKTINLISDGGAATAIETKPNSGWFGTLSRVTSLMSDQPNDLRIENIIRSASSVTLIANNFGNFYRNPCDARALTAREMLFERERGMRVFLASEVPDTYAYWSVRRVPKVHVGMTCPSALLSNLIAKEVRELASIPTDLSALEPSLQARLINWGYISAHHGLPYVSSLILGEVRLEQYVRDCNMPFAPEVVDPNSALPSARALTCLPYKDWSGDK